MMLAPRPSRFISKPRNTSMPEKSRARIGPRSFTGHRLCAMNAFRISRPPLFVASVPILLCWPDWMSCLGAQVDAQEQRDDLQRGGLEPTEEDWYGTVWCRVVTTLMLSTQPKGIRMKRRSARLVSDFTACFPSLRNRSSRLEGNGWVFTGRVREIRCVHLSF